MPSARRVLVVDDDEMLRASLGVQFAANGYAPVEAGSYEEGFARGREGLYEFMVLDVSLPDSVGRVLCRPTRGTGATCPIAAR